MTENANPQHRPAEPARHMLREWLIDALALVVGASAVLYYQPEGFIAGLIVFVGAYTLTHSLQRLNWKWLAGICELLLIFLAPVLHLGTLMMVPVGTTVTGLVFTFLLPGIAQTYWVWESWSATGTVSQPLTVLCAAWLALLAIRIVAQIMLVDWRAPRQHRIRMNPLPKLRRPQIRKPSDKAAARTSCQTTPV